MFANRNIKFEMSTPSFLVSSALVVINNEKRFVIRLKNGKTEWVGIRTGIAGDNKTEIFCLFLRFILCS